MPLFLEKDFSHAQLIPLSPRQKKVLDFIDLFQKKQGFAPSRREIAAALGLRSIATVQQHICTLQKKGFLEKEVKGCRNLKLIQSKSQFDHSQVMVSLSLVGQVVAGYPIESFEFSERIDVPAYMLKPGGEYFVLRVSGNSMLQDGIFDQDLVIIKKQLTAFQGATVVALVEGEATIKRFYKYQDRIELHPSHPEFHPIIVKPDQDFQMKGIMVGLIRCLK